MNELEEVEEWRELEELKKLAQVDKVVECEVLLCCKRCGRKSDIKTKFVYDIVVSADFNRLVMKSFVKCPLCGWKGKCGIDSEEVVSVVEKLCELVGKLFGGYVSDNRLKH